MRSISERDWKVFRELRPLALERFCERTLNELNRLTADASQTSHERYLAVFKLIDERAKELGLVFDSLRRSTAMQQLACFQSRDLLTEEEASRFSSETREYLLLMREFTGV